ncbi:MAG: site-specific integrase, partial [Candidatus Saccharibacteria bacterium]|nr:site-specific integrase [Candidatus Saccharibacteria bacterium]
MATLGKLNLGEVTSEDIDAFKELLKKQRYTGKSISRKINSIKAFFRFLIAEKLIDTNPAEIIAHPKFDQTPP